MVHRGWRDREGGDRRDGRGLAERQAATTRGSKPRWSPLRSVGFPGDQRDRTPSLADEQDGRAIASGEHAEHAEPPLTAAAAAQLVGGEQGVSVVPFPQQVEKPSRSLSGVEGFEV